MSFHPPPTQALRFKKIRCVQPRNGHVYYDEYVCHDHAFRVMEDGKFNYEVISGVEKAFNSVFVGFNSVSTDED